MIRTRERTIDDAMADDNPTRARPGPHPDRVATAALVVSARAGDTAAFATLYRNFHRYVARIVADGVADHQACDDINQAVFETAWLKLETLRDPESFKPWLAQITRHMIIDHHRRESRTVATDFAATSDTAAEPVADDWSAHDWAAMRSLAEQVDVALAGLSARYATALELAATFGFGAKEIGAALDIEPGHARVVLHRARQRLSAALVDSLGDD